MHALFIRTKGMDEDAGDYGDGFEELPWRDNDLMGLTPEAYATLKELEKHLQSNSMEDVLAGTFGDGVQVTVTAEGVTVDEFDHD